MIESETWHEGSTKTDRESWRFRQDACCDLAEQALGLTEEFVKTRPHISLFATLTMLFGMIISAALVSAAQTTPSTQQPTSQAPPATSDTPSSQAPAPSTQAPSSQMPQGSSDQPGQTAPSQSTPDQTTPSRQTPDQATPPATQGQTGSAQGQAGQTAAPDAAGTQTFTGTVMQQGDKYVLQADNGTVYDIDHQDQVKKFDGKKVRVHGTLDSTGKMIHIQ